MTRNFNRSCFRLNYIDLCPFHGEDIACDVCVLYIETIKLYILKCRCIQFMNVSLFISYYPNTQLHFFDNA